MTSRKTKPDCSGSSSQPCGYSCISDKDMCSGTVGADIASKLIATATATANAPDATTASAAAAAAAATGAALLMTSDISEESIKAFNKLGIAKAQAKKAEAISSIVGDPPGGLGLAVWLGKSYYELSAIARADKEDSAKLLAEFGKSKYDSLSAGVAMAAKAVSLLPQAEASLINDLKSRKKLPLVDDLAMTKLNRFANMPAEALAKYTEGATVKENGFFGTSYLDEKYFSEFSDGADTHFVVKSKGFGKTAAKATDILKAKVFEGELLFTPGTSFKVTKVDPPISFLDEQKAPTNFSESEQLLILYNDSKVKFKGLNALDLLSPMSRLGNTERDTTEEAKAITSSLGLAPGSLIGSPSGGVTLSKDLMSDIYEGYVGTRKLLTQRDLANAVLTDNSPIASASLRVMGVLPSEAIQLDSSGESLSKSIDAINKRLGAAVLELSDEGSARASRAYSSNFRNRTKIFLEEL